MSINYPAQQNDINWNRRVYQRLKLALSLGLRRQVFVAVCDDLHLRNQVAARLQSTLGNPKKRALFPASGEAEAYPRLVTLRLNLKDPNPIAQINSWLAQHPPPIVTEAKDKPGRRLPVPGFQLIGVEKLTRQSVAIQRLFLTYLRSLEEHLSTLDTSLVLWVPRPWLYAIQQSAPQFWRCRTAVFLFAGEPTPTLEHQSHPSAVSPPRTQDLAKAGDESVVISAPQEDTHSRVLEPVEAQLTAESVVNLPTVPTLNYVGQELATLVLATSTAAISQTESTQQVIQDLQPLELLVEIEQLHAQESSPTTLASAYQQLGNLYRDRIEQGESTTENLMVAALAYEQAIHLFEEPTPEVADIFNDLGTLYWMLYRTPPSPEQALAYLEHAIQVYQLALSLTAPEMQPQTYARVQNNLGSAYGDLARYTNPAENWLSAIAAYNEALRYRFAEVEPLRYAATQNNLGTAYWHLAQHNQPVENLRQAISSYQAALTCYDPNQEPLNYGMIQNNIGTAYWNLAQYQQSTEYLQGAIDAYQQALMYRTAAVVPSACAATHNNLGTAYWHLANHSQTVKQQRHEYLNLAIDAYEEALALAHSLSNFPLTFDLFATHNNLGLAYYQVALDAYFPGDKTTRSGHLESSLLNHLQALEGYNKQQENYQNTITYIVKAIRAFHTEFGIQGQNLALSKVPGHLLPELLPKL